MQKTYYIPSNNLNHFSLKHISETKNLNTNQIKINDNFIGGSCDDDVSVAIVIFLNNNFEGGELLLGIDKKVIPKTGKIVMFTGGPENIHRVNEIIKGKRNTMLLWLSEKKLSLKEIVFLMENLLIKKIF